MSEATPQNGPAAPAVAKPPPKRRISLALQGSLLVRRVGMLTPVHHWLDYASVTTTENFVLCAVAAQGTSTLTNAASEPHVQEFCRFMQMLGAQIEGVGTSRLTVHGGGDLGGGEGAGLKGG